MALRALSGRMLSRQWESGTGMIEGRTRPIRRGVTLRTILREGKRRMIRIRRGLVIIGMA